MYVKTKRLVALLLIMSMVMVTTTWGNETKEQEQFLQERVVNTLETDVSLDRVDKNISNDQKKEKPEIDSIIDTQSNFFSTTEAYAVAAQNTSIDGAEYIAYNSTTESAISIESEMRWYVTQLNERTKLSAILQMDATLDTDAYLYYLDEDTGFLQLVAYSAYSGLGTSEYIDYVADAGIYFIGINGYEGVGNYQLFLFGSTKDVSNELNETRDQATTISKNECVTGVIDNPYDYDVYELNLSETVFLIPQFTNSSSNDYRVYVTQDGSNFSDITGYEESISLGQGDYYFYVFSGDGGFDSEATYQLELQVIYDASLTLLAYSAAIDAYLQSDGTSYYLNGNLLDFTYSYENHVSNSAGWINTYMGLYGQNGRAIPIISEYNANLFGLEPATFARFTTNSDTGWNDDTVLVLWLIEDESVSNTYLSYVRRYVGGEYKEYESNINETFPIAKVVIDVETGEVIDMLLPNFYYEGGYRTYNITPYN